MADARKRPCCICRRWFRPDRRIGSRQQACRRPECQAARRKKKQKAWRERNPEYFTARRIKDRSGQDRQPEPLRLPPPPPRITSRREFLVLCGLCLRGGLMPRLTDNCTDSPRRV